jgi:hypothetical protein
MFRFLTVCFCPAAYGTVFWCFSCDVKDLVPIARDLANAKDAEGEHRHVTELSKKVLVEFVSSDSEYVVRQDPYSHEPERDEGCHVFHKKMPPLSVSGEAHSISPLHYPVY